MNANLRIRPTAVPRAIGAFVALFLFALALPVQADDLKDARTAFAAGQLDVAMQRFERAASQGYAEGRAGVGQVLLRKRQLVKAQEAFELAIKMDANLAMGHYGVGEVLRRQGDCASALPHLQRAVELDRKYPDAALALGDCLVQLGRHNDALGVLNPGLNWGAKARPRFLVALGNAEMARDSLRDAGIYFTQAQQAAPDDPITNRALGEFYVKRGIGGLAVDNLQRAVSLDTTDAELRHALGQAFYYDQRYNEALEQFKRVAEMDPEFPAGQLSLGNLYYLSGPADARRYADARPYLEKYTQMMPKDAKGWSLLGRDYYFLKMKDESVTALSTAVSLGDKSKEAYRILGRAYVDKKDWARALEAYSKADLESADAFRIAQVHAILGNFTAADSVYAGMVEKDSTSSEAKVALVEWGKLKYRQKDYPGAIAAFQRRLALDPNSDEAYYYTGLSNKELKQIPQALAALRQSTALAPTKADRFFWLGMTLVQADSINASDVAFTQVTVLDSASKNTAVAFQQLGFHQLLNKNWSGAVVQLERSIQIDDKNVATLVWLGQAYQNSGNKTKAIETYRKVLALQPGQQDAVKGLKLLGV
ncbi:MAG: tetratricopeptide repeat protein [Candidatus Eisenbacteria bacterium]